MNIEEFNKVVDFYQNTILQQVIRPIEINEIYAIIHPEVENPQGIAYKLKQRAISVFVQTRKTFMMKSFEEFLMSMDTSESANTKGSAADTDAPQSHSEDFTNNGKSDSQDVNETLESQKVYPIGGESDLEEVTEATNQSLVSDTDVQIALLENQYEEIELTDDITIDEEAIMSDADVEILLLENQYAQAQDANEKRSLKMRINKLNKNK
jgi:hypothetical protein